MVIKAQMANYVLKSLVDSDSQRTEKYLCLQLTTHSKQSHRDDIFLT